VRIGYTLASEQSGPRALVEHAARAEEIGFDMVAITDHYSPWLAEQGHSPYAWSVLGALCQVTQHVELMTFVTCPTVRYHPAVVAQKAATTQLLSGHRFTLGLGSGENLNEHVVGQGWPPVRDRHLKLVEAMEIINLLFDGDYVNYVGKHFSVDSAKLWDLPEVRVPTAVAVGGPKSVERFAPLADTMVNTVPDAELVRLWDQARPSSRKIAQLAVCWDTDHDRAVDRVHEQFRWVLGGWKVNTEIVGPAEFAEATRDVTPGQVAEIIPCGPDIDRIVTVVDAYRAAGFTDLTILQVGGDQQAAFLDLMEHELLDALRR
jgi:G6PDH family F420-dependent oxidoreductase